MGSAEFALPGDQSGQTSAIVRVSIKVTQAGKSDSLHRHSEQTSASISLQSVPFNDEQIPLPCAIANTPHLYTTGRIAKWFAAPTTEDGAGKSGDVATPGAKSTCERTGKPFAVRQRTHGSVLSHAESCSWTPLS
jgi:hypothetical protein